MSRVLYLIPALAVLILAAFFGWVMVTGVDTKTLDVAVKGQQLPEFTLPNLLNLDADVQTADLLGQPMLLNVWATWCPTCKVEHPVLNELAQQGINIIGIDWKDDAELAQKWLRDFNNPYRINIFDIEGFLPLDLGVTGAPETFFVDSNGVIVHRHQGAITQTNWQSELKAIYEGMQ